MKRMMCAIAVAALLVPGCSTKPPPIVPVSGVVRINGVPLAGAEVTFLPTTKGLDGNYAATAVTDEQGRYELKTNGQTGACATECVVVVAEGPMPDEARSQKREAQEIAARYLAGLKNRPIPAQYGTAAQSPLRVTVKAGQTDYPLELVR